MAAGGRPARRAADQLIIGFAAPVASRLARRVLKQDAMNASSRAWAWYVNSFAASPLLRGRERQDVYRRAGMAIDTNRIGPACYFHTSMVSIGAETLLNHGCHIENVAPVEVGEFSALSLYVTILTSHHTIGGADRRCANWEPRPVSIGRGSWIGARATILPGVTVGDGCVIAAGAVVTADCEDHSLYAGVPARRLRELPK